LQRVERQKQHGHYCSENTSNLMNLASGSLFLWERLYQVSPQSPHPSPGVQLRGGNRQIRTTVPPLARGVTPVIACPRPGQRCHQRSARQFWPCSGRMSKAAGGLMHSGAPVAQKPNRPPHPSRSGIPWLSRVHAVGHRAFNPPGPNRGPRRRARGQGR